MIQLQYLQEFKKRSRMKFISLLTIIAFGSFGLHGQNCDDLFISGYLEGSSYDKAIEIYNPTANSISLNNYKIRV